MTDRPALMRTDMPGLTLHNRGKVRDIYDLGEHLLIVATDRVSAFDVIMPNPIPDKGRVLTAMTLFWFDLLGDRLPHHLVSTEVDDYPEPARRYREQLEGRSMLVRKARVVPIECVARGYLAGSGLKEYRQQGTVTDIPLPAGLRESDRLPEPIFTPAIKAESGHDENISFEKCSQMVGEPLARQLRDLTLMVYGVGSDYAAKRGIIIADTKFEFGLLGERLILVDEVMTPDSSRFWDAREWQPGRPQDSFDKQPLRDWLEAEGWNKEPPAPTLPPEVISMISGRYREAYRRITGRELD